MVSVLLGENNYVFVLFCFCVFFVWQGGRRIGVSVIEQLILLFSNFMDKVKNDGSFNGSFDGLSVRQLPLVSTFHHGNNVWQADIET